MGSHLRRSDLAVVVVVALLCAALIGLGWLMGGTDVFAVEPQASAEPLSDVTPVAATPAPTKAPTPADTALQVTEQVERVAMRQALRNVQPVTRTVNAGLEESGWTVSCTFVPTYVDGTFGGYSYVVNGAAYLALSDASSMLGFEAEETAREGNTVEYTAAEMPVSATVGATSFLANGRYINAPGGVQVLDGKLLLPLSSMEQIFGVTASYDAAAASVSIDASDLTLIEDGESYYARQDIYWLSRIIYAEANGQPFDGMIGVGNVVLNRVASARFPDTIEAVVFEPGQFTPVDNGSIYNEPSDEAIRAAEMCLDGVNTVGNSLFFVNPSACDSSWFQNSLAYVTTIGGHVFYA